jgi:hypothetical protein
MANKGNNPWANQRKKDAQTKNTEYWLDVLAGEENPDLEIPKDENFEVEQKEKEQDSFPSLMTTISTNPERPRTLKAGYDFQNENLIVIFRDGTWWEYRGVPVYMWYDFLSAESKGRFLRESGLDHWSDMGPVDINSMPKHRRVQMSNIKEFSDRMYLGAKE